MCVLAGMCVATSHTRTRMTRVSVLHIKYIELYCHNALMGIAISYPYGYRCGTELLGDVLIGITINLINPCRLVKNLFFSEKVCSRIF